MKTTLICIIVALFCLPQVLAAVVYQGTQVTGEEFYVQGEKFVLTYYPQNEKLTFSGETVTAIVEMNDCEERNSWVFCFEGLGESTYRGGQEFVSATIKIEAKGPSVSVSREFSSSDLSQEVAVTAVVKNTGEMAAQDFWYKDAYPTTIQIMPENVDVINNEVSWKGTLKIGEEKELKYKLKANDLVKYDSVASYSYAVGKTRANQTTKEKTLEYKPPFDINMSLSTLVPSVGEDVTLSITINNTQEEGSMSIDDISISLPDSYPITTFSQGFTKKPGLAQYQGKLEAGKSSLHEITFTAAEKGKYDLTVEIAVTAGGKTFRKREDFTLRTGISTVIPVINVSSTSIDSGDELTLKLDLDNQGTAYAEQLVFTIKSDLFETKEFKDNKLNAHTKKQYYKKTITVPDVTERVEKKVQVQGSYINDIGKTFDFEEEATIVILPRDLHFKITHQTQKVKRKDQNVLHVEVFVMNTESYPFQAVDIFEVLPKGLKKVEGEVLVNKDLPASVNESVYAYDLEIPAGYDINVVTLKTYINTKQEDGSLYKFSKESTVNIGDLIPAQDEKAADDKTSAQDTGNKTSEKTAPEEGSKKGNSFWSKIYQFLFGWLG